MGRPQTMIATTSRTVALAALAILLFGADCTSGIDLQVGGDLDAAPQLDADTNVGGGVDCETGTDAGADGDAGADADADFEAGADGDLDQGDDADPDDDVEVDADVDADTGHDVGADDDDDADADAAPGGEADAEVADEEDAETEADAETCADGWYDSTSGLCWQDPPDGTMRNWGDAVTYCDGLVLGGHTDWHLPTIGELRTLIRGCPATMTGGTCGVTDACLERLCLNEACSGCPYSGGPGVDGGYWPPELGGSPVRTGWSSSSSPGDTRHAWAVDFHRGSLGADYYLNVGPTRCVRPGP